MHVGPTSRKNTCQTFSLPTTDVLVDEKRGESSFKEISGTSDIHTKNACRGKSFSAPAR